MNRQNRTKACACGKTFETSRFSKPRKCPDCYEVEYRQNPSLWCKLCGEFDRGCRQRVCKACRDAKLGAIRAEREAPVERRARTEAERYFELYMAKHSPSNEDLTPRQQLALDRKLTNRYAHVIDDCFEEFKALCFVIAFQQGKLSESRWQWFRSYRTDSITYRTAITKLHHEIWGDPAHWQPDERDYNSQFVGKALPKLRAIAETGGLPGAEREITIEIKPAKKSDKSSEIESRWANLLDGFATLFYLRATPDRQEIIRQHWAKDGKTHLLEMIGYTIKEILPELEAQAINPEEEAHANQDAIDSAFFDIMEGFEL